MGIKKVEFEADDESIKSYKMFLLNSYDIKVKELIYAVFIF
jgi:hypothetical protein